MCKVLIVDDHPAIIEGYKNALKYGLQDHKIIFDKAKDCEETIAKINSCKGDYNLIILDISLPAFKQMNINSGEDLGVWIRDNFPKIKIFVITGYADALRLNNIYNLISPEGFLIKSEASSIDIISAFKNIIKNNIVLGPTISKLIVNKARNSFHIDDISLNILKEISNGTRTIDLPKYIPLSKSGIEKRKRLLKSYFNNETDSDRELIINAKKSGYI